MNSKNEIYQFSSQIRLNLVEGNKALEEFKKVLKESIKIQIQCMIIQTVVGQIFIFLKLRDSQCLN